MHGVTFLSSYPTLELFLSTTPWNQPRRNRFDYAHHRAWYGLLEKVWMSCGEEDLARDLEDFDPEAILARVEGQVQALQELERRIECGSVSEEELRPLQQGYLGVGLSYFVGTRR